MLLGAAILGGCSSADETGSSTDELIGGFPASSSKLNAVGALGLLDSSGANTPFCTGTLISPTMVLTAKHCVSTVDVTKLSFLIGPNAFLPIRTVAVRGVAVEPTIPGGGVPGFGADVGIVHLAVPVLDVATFPLAALTDDRIGSRLVALGYGVRNSSGAHGTRHSGSMTLRATQGSAFAATFGTFENFVASGGAARHFPDLDPNDPFELAQLQQNFDAAQLIPGIEAWFGAAAGDAQTCSGDDGGPITAKVGTATTVFGVASWQFGSDGSCLLDGSSFASVNPVSLDFVDYESNCPLIPRAGTCEGANVAVRCADPSEGGRRELRTDCGELGLVCGFDETGAISCVDDPCEGLPPGGLCNGDIATRCSVDGEGPRHVVTTDCAAQGQTCSTDSGTATCVTQNTCLHDKCFTGPALTASCDTCVAQICNVDPFCCNIFWDGLCVAEVSSVCGLSCP